MNNFSAINMENNVMKLTPYDYWIHSKLFINNYLAYFTRIPIQGSVLRELIIKSWNRKRNVRGLIRLLFIWISIKQVARRSYVITVFLKISQNLLESTCLQHQIILHRSWILQNVVSFCKRLLLRMLVSIHGSFSLPIVNHIDC